MLKSKIHNEKVSADSSGMRLDLFVVQACKDITRSQSKRMIEEGLVLVNGKCVKVAHTLAKNDEVSIELRPAVSPSAIPEDIPLDIIYEDPDIIVVNKPAGMVVHPAAGHPDGTLVNALLSHCKDLSGIGGELKAGIVHRLDMGTSGTIIAAKNDHAHLALAAQFKDRKVSKTYLALVLGIMRTKSGRFDSAIGRSKGDRKKISSNTRKGRASLTEWKVIKEFGKSLSWLEIKLHTGRMHQIRVHFSEAGHPLAGDTVYGGTKKINKITDSKIHDIVSSLSRPALHAWKLEIDHPRTKERMNFEAKLPDDLKDLLSKLSD